MLAVGGTTLTAKASGAYISETAWAGSGGGFSHLYAHHGFGSVNPAIYRISRSASYHRAFHDVTAGSNLSTGGNAMASPAAPAGCQAGPGWDPVTGWGSPNAQLLVPGR